MYSRLLMRRFREQFILCLCLASLLVVLASDSPLNAQAAQQGKYVTQASARLIKLINVANKDGYTLQDNSFSIGGGWLKQGENNWVGLFTVELTEGRSYRFLAAGDADARDVDLQVVDPNNVARVFIADEGKEADAVVTFRPQSSGRHLVRVRLFESVQNQPCVCLGIVMTK